MNKQTLIGIAVVIILAIGGYVLATNAPTQQENTTATSTPQETATSTTNTGGTSNTGAKNYTLAQVATHSDKASCWTAINGSVYDLTSWISQHPGGQENILSICGKDGTTAFENQHGGKQKQADILATFKIGALKQ